jgi:hypothetical protein
MYVFLCQDEEKSDTEATTFISVDEEVSLKEEPASPASSIISNLSESTRRRSRGNCMNYRGWEAQ